MRAVWVQIPLGAQEDNMTIHTHGGTDAPECKTCAGQVTYYIGMKAQDLGFDAHLTVRYLGQLDKERQHYVKDILSNIKTSDIYVERKALAMFGPKKNLPVVKVRLLNPDLTWVQQTLDKYGIASASDYAWNPHISIKLERVRGTLHIPKIIRLTDLNLYC